MTRAAAPQREACAPGRAAFWLAPGYWRFCRARDHARSQAPAGALRDCLNTPPPAPSQPVARTRFLAVDIETTGLDPQRDAILSIGWVALDGTSIDLATAGHVLVRPQREVPEQSAVIHGITDHRAATGGTPGEALDALFRALDGRVLIAHHAALELGFLARACERHYGTRPPLAVVDTLRLAETSRRRAGRPIPARGLRLHVLRGEYNLPARRTHDALLDALGAAELFAALIAERDPTGELPLGRVLFRPRRLW
ncbi:MULTISPECIES: exonuclease domain-containing protein [Thioalkalivibrio]|uniref:3'-5' exonuclease n=1 Tax=Thioalkalivibrio TaxID=106633 RepID=UPI00036A6E1C|nr:MULTISPECIES: exonuclease domain-containing protein [Thioalkalivibrio]PYG04381.1 DNA polymerase-3 subunit epsilon [Thioalkalivibrio sp. ALE21]